MFSLLAGITQLFTLMPSDTERQMLDHHIEVCGNSTLYHLQREKSQTKYKRSYKRPWIPRISSKTAKDTSLHSWLTNPKGPEQPPPICYCSKYFRLRQGWGGFRSILLFPAFQHSEHWLSCLCYYRQGSNPKEMDGTRGCIQQWGTGETGNVLFFTNRSL